MRINSSPKNGAWRPNPAHCLFYANKILLEDSHAYLSAYCLGLFYATVTELGTCDRDHMCDWPTSALGKS